MEAHARVDHNGITKRCSMIMECKVVEMGSVAVVTSGTQSFKQRAK